MIYIIVFLLGLSGGIIIGVVIDKDYYLKGKVKMEKNK